MRAALYLLALAGLSGASPALAQQSDCDSQIRALEDHQLGYRQRGDRCEGLFSVQRFGSASIEIASFSNWAHGIDLAGRADLQLSWRAPNSGDIHISAVSLKHRVYYRMDAHRRQVRGDYRWPLEVVQALEMTRRDLGLAGAARLSIGGIPQDVLVPIRVDADQGPASSGYEVVVIPSFNVTRLDYSLAPLEEDGLPGRFLFYRKPFTDGPRMADQPVRFVLSLPQEEEFYSLEISGEPLEGSLTGVSALFVLYNPRL